MAIPLTNDSELVEEQYRRLERILYELYLVLRALMEPQVQPSTSASNQHPPRGGSGGGSRRHRRRNSSARGRRSSPNSSNSNQQNGPRNPPPPPPPASGSQAATMLLNLANRGVAGHLLLQQNNQTCAKSVESSTAAEWSKVGCDLRTIADTINLETSCQSFSPASPKSPSSKSSTPATSSSSSSSTGSTLKLVTLALSLMMSRNWSSD
ncbi:uncharacterized protein LOC132193469 [Neocloeon triangulifer]|uniref:uncharacterized protein LOC132193469 n=1 Tax=Neocloeon triangulifer TaxID=2078957 RepID=UPI00286F920E|nr:uncharacterized protein LOC132193469 [Neocloeon triangulifer]